MKIQRVVMFSGGSGSWGAARRVADEHGTDGLALLFADTLIEDPDLYRFLDEAAADIGVPLIRVADGRTPWQVFKDRRMLGNSRIAPCSTELKQKPARAWMKANAPDAAVVLGIDWTESHRLPGAVKGWAPWRVEAPLCERPYVAKADLLVELGQRGIRPPDLYSEGFPHNNCGGGCVRSGAAQFRLLLQRRPGTFAEWEAGEVDVQCYLGSTATILRDRSGGQVTPLPLRVLRERLERQPSLFADEEWGGCGCFLESEQ